MSRVIEHIYDDRKPKYDGSSEYDYYLKRIDVFKLTYEDELPPGIYDTTIKLESRSDYRISYYIWDLYRIADGHGDYYYNIYDDATDINKFYKWGYGIEAPRIDVQGGYAMECIADTIYINYQLEADCKIWQSETYHTYSDEEVCENYMTTPGGAVDCKAERIYIFGGALFDSTASIHLDVETVECEDTGEIVRSTAEDCTLASTDDNPTSLFVGYGATAKNILMKKNPYYDYKDEARIGSYYFNEDNFRKFGYAEAVNLTVENGDVYVHNGGKLNGASVHGTLYAEEAGAVLQGDIACAAVKLKDVTPVDNVTIKVDLREHAIPFFEEWIENKYVEYYANYKTITYVYDPDSIQYWEWNDELIPYYTELLSVTEGFFTNKDGRFDMRNEKHSFRVNLGEVDAKALSKIVIDFDGTDEYFDDGYFYFEYPHKPITTGEDVYEYIPFTEYDLPFQFAGDKSKYSVEYHDGEIAFYYDSLLYGRTEEVLWLEHGEDADYEIALAPLMKEAVGEGEVTLDAGATTVVSPVKSAAVTVKGEVLDGGNITVKAEDSQHRELTCDVDLIVVPEELPIIGKKGTKHYAELVRKVRKVRKPTEVTTSVSATLPCDFKCEVWGMKFDISSLSANVIVNWTAVSITLKLQGKLEWEFGKKGNRKKITIDLSGDNYFSVKHTNKKNEWTLVGELKVPDMKFGKFEFSDMGIKVNTAESSFTGSATVQLPWIKYGFSGSIGIAGGYLDSMALTVHGFNLPLGATGLFVTSIGGGIEGIATSLNLTFTGNMGLTYGPVIEVEWDCEWLGIDNGTYSLCEIALDSKVTTNGDIQGKAAVTSLGGYIKGNGEVKAGGGSFSMKGEFTMLNDFIVVSGELTSSKEAGVAITGVGKFQVPKHEHFGMFRGMTLSVNARANFTKRFVMAWESMTVFGNQISVGIKCSFDKKIKVSLVGASDLVNGGDLGAKGGTRGASSPKGLRGALPPSASDVYIVDGDGTSLFQFYFEDEGAYASLSYDGTEYMQADIADGLYENMQLVSELSSDLCVTIAVNNAEKGEWTLNAYGDENATFGAFSVLPGSAPEPVLTGVALGEGQRSAIISYTMGDISALENATLSVYRVEGDSTDYAGTLICMLEDEHISDGLYVYEMPDELMGGSYSFYLMLESDNYVPSFSVISEALDFRVLDDEAPDQIQRINAQWSSSGTQLTWDEPYDNIGVTCYKVRYSIANEYGWYFDWESAITETASFSFDGMPNGMYAYDIAAYDAAGNEGMWSTEENVLVLNTANAIYNGVTLTEDLQLDEYESMVNVTATGVMLAAAENSLVSGTALGDAEIGGILEESSVMGNVTLLAGGTAYGTIVSGSFTVFGTADGVTVETGGQLTIGDGGVARNVTVEAGGTLLIMEGAEYDGISVAYDATMMIPVEGVVSLEGDITTASPIMHYCYIKGDGHSIHFEQCMQNDEYSIKDGAYRDETALVADMDRFIGGVLDIVIDTGCYGDFKIADAAGSFSGGLRVTDSISGKSVLLDLNEAATLGRGVCALFKDDGGLWLNVASWDYGIKPVQTLAWTSSGSGGYVVEYSADSFQTALRVSVASNSLDTFAVPAGDYKWRVRTQDSDVWSAAETVHQDAEGDNAPKLMQSNADGVEDLFFAKARGTWGDDYLAKHNGIKDGWTGTGELLALSGKNVLADIIKGSSDANVLLMTDDANGDALFVDDIFSDLPCDVAQQQSRLAQIDEIRAGAGDDIVDLTSHEFAYHGHGGMIVRGGLGNDVIWANDGGNWLFGDAGDDSITGASGDEVLVGGCGDDILHGGGGNDIFAFGGDWGQDTVRQLAGGGITLWFAENSGSWDGETLTYTCGDNSVKVIGECQNITLRFGNENALYSVLLAEGAFSESTSEKVFEEKGRGMLAS